MSRRLEEAQAAAASNFPPITALPVTEPQVILAFHGLLSLRFKNPGGAGSGFCEVGMHADAPKHNFTIKAFDLTKSGEDPFYTYNAGPAGSSPLEKIRFDAVNADPAAVKFYQPAGFEYARPGVPRKVTDPLDFRQVSDFECPEFYYRDLRKNEGLFRPRLILKTGIFVSLLLSQNTFKRKAFFDELNLGQITEFVAAGMYLKAGGLCALRVGDAEVRFELNPAPAKTLYLVLFDNSCPPKVCKFDGESSIKEERNDFFEYYKMFAIPDDGEEFEMLLQSKREDAPELPALRPGTEAYRVTGNFLHKTIQKESNNDAPCGPGAFGSGRSGG